MKTIEQILTKNKYPGRGLIFGIKKNKAFIAYFIMGRSKNSKNRILIFDEKKDIKTKLYKKKDIINEDLIIYRASVHLKNKIIVSNGKQTETIVDHIKNKKSFEEAIRSCDFENDPPIYTPRISGIMEFYEEKVSYKISIIKAEIFEDKISTNRHFFEYPSPIDGTGDIIYTYSKKKENETASFCGEPKKIYIPNSLEEFEKKIWNSLYENYKISLFVESIDLKTKEKENKIININK